MLNESDIQSDFLENLRFNVDSVAFLLQKSRSTILNWANGYLSKRKHAAVYKKPMLRTEREKSTLISFPELIELLYVKKLTESGINSDDIRIAVENLADEYGEFPLTNADLYLVGKQLVSQNSGEDGGLFNVVAQQELFEYAHELKQSLEFKDSVLFAWYPDPTNVDVRVSPFIKFGAPCVENVPTKLIFDRYLLEGKDEDMSDLGEWFDLSQSQVSSAVEFESKWRQPRKSA